MSGLDDASLTAWLDGELPPEEAARVADVLERDSQARARLARLQAADLLVRRAFEAPLREPVPERLLQVLDRAGGAPAKVVPFRRRLAAALPSARLVLAASVLLALGLGAGLGLGRLGTAPVPAWIGEAVLADALERVPAGQPVALETAGIAVEVTPLLTFRDREGRPCREFELRAAGRDDAQGIACRAPGGAWRAEAVAFVAPAGAARGDGYVPAAGAPAARIDAVREAMSDEPPLSPGAEAELLGRGWR